MDGTPNIWKVREDVRRFSPKLFPEFLFNGDYPLEAQRNALGMAMVLEIKATRGDGLWVANVWHEKESPGPYCLTGVEHTARDSSYGNDWFTALYSLFLSVKNDKQALPLGNCR